MQSIFSNMNNPNIQLLQQFAQFKKSIQGKDPNAMLNELLKSGRFTQADVDRARAMATTFQSLLR